MKCNSSPLAAESAAPADFCEASATDLDAPDNLVNWLWHGYLAPGNMTLLTSQWKSGKTTLLSVLLARMRTGGMLAGLEVRPGPAIVVSEESRTLWKSRHAALRFGDNVRWLCRPFQGRPRPEQWLALIDHMLAARAQRGLELVVIDPLAAFLPGRTENDAATMMEALLPLQRLCERGVCVLILHHPRKGESSPGQAARGSGALSGNIDILIEMSYYGPPLADDRRRKLHAFSRLPGTPRRLVIELNPEGNDYVSLGDFQEDDFGSGWEVLCGIFEDAHAKLTKQGIAEAWPVDFVKPAQSTLWRWLEQAVKDGRLLRDGTGRSHHPFRYWLPGQEEKWRHDPLHLEDLPELMRLT
ncbi:MAG TPA: AAA family ATPase [Gemmataceae bacterium]|nr:AAA family ATPase [Gemmataceae bacterium]